MVRSSVSTPSRGRTRRRAVRLVGPDARGLDARRRSAGPATPAPRRAGTTRSTSSARSVRTKPPSASGDADATAGSAATPTAARTAGSPTRGPSSDKHGQIGGLGDDVGPEDHLAQVGQQRLAAPRFGVDDGDAVELGLQPVIFDTTLDVEAQILDDGAVGKVDDVLGGDRVQPLAALVAGERMVARCERSTTTTSVCRGTLLAERVAVVPRGAGVGTGLWGGDGGHPSSVRRSAGTILRPHGDPRRDRRHPRRRGRHRGPSRRATSTTRCSLAATASSRPCWSATGAACLLDAHLERLARSAAIVGLPRPGRGPVADRRRRRRPQAWTGAGDAVLRMVFGRGRAADRSASSPSRRCPTGHWSRGGTGCRR